MSREDLDKVQAQMRVAIQNHQVLVTRMKKEPQNPALQEELRTMQAEIQSLSEKQRSIVHQLRKVIVSKDDAASNNNTQTSSSIQPPPAKKPALSTNPVVTQASTQILIKFPQGPNNSPVTTQGQGKPSSSQGPGRPSTSPKGPGRPPAQGSRSSPTPKGKVKVPQLANTGSAPSVVGRKSPPIRVPQYPLHRPSILQGGRSSILSSGTSTSTSPKLPSKTTTVSGNGRKSSDNNGCYDSSKEFRKKIHFDIKQLSPEERKKVEFMAALDLITKETLKELQNRRSERKRRSTANPQFSYGPVEADVQKKQSVNYLSSPAPGVKRPRGRPPKAGYSPGNSRPGTPSQTTSVSSASPEAGPAAVERTDSTESDVHEDFCAVCQRSGELLMCDTCNLVYHLQCLEPPLTSVPSGAWSCPKCIELNKSTGLSTEMLALVHSYIAHRTSKEEEKKKLQKRNADLEKEKATLQKNAQRYSESITEQIKEKARLLTSNRDTQQSVEWLNNFIKVFQAP